MSIIGREISTVRAPAGRLVHWTPALALPTVVLLLAPNWSAVLIAWMLAFAIYAGFKWLAFANSRAARRASVVESLEFLLLWPGMDADAFLSRLVVRPPSVREVSTAVLLTLAGLLLVFSVPFFWQLPAGIRGWIALIGLALLLLFGAAQLVSIAWRICGVDAQPIMNKPLRATSLADFWGARWNLAFHDIGRIFILRPLGRRFGWTAATIAVFLFSGIVHDVVMSIPVRAGYGLPTLYFLLQGCAVLFERSRLGKRLGLARGWRGRVFAAVLVLGPLGLLFHQPFLQGVVLPTIAWITPE